MASIDDLLKGNVVTGLAIGIGAAVIAPLLAPLVASVSKPVAKSMIKAGILFYEKGRETAAELGEVFDDLVAEVRSELQASHAAGALAAAEAASPTPGAAEPAPGPGEPAAS
jgi:hypothetical protein